MINRPHVDWSKNLTLYEVNVRQYTKEGTLKAFQKHIPRLKELGIGILWLMPIQPIGLLNRKGALGSYYSIQNYIEVNPEFGTLKDFKDLVKKCHNEGIYVMLDWVANHTAWDHVWTKSNPDFYNKDEHGNFKAPYPEWADVIHLNYDKQGLRKQMIEDMKYWVTECDIDGFRCDMAHLVPTSFWNEAREELEKIKPLFMLAETENRDLLEYAFDMCYGWRIFHTQEEIAQWKKSVHDLDNLLPHDVFGFPLHAFQMLFTDNHDENSWHGSAIKRFHESLPLFTVMNFTLPGFPLIYSGQEAGFDKQIAFFDKDEIVWKKDKTSDFIQKLSQLRLENPALWSGYFGGNMTRVYTSDNQAVFAYLRQKENNKIFVILNVCNSPLSIKLEGKDFCGGYTDYFTGEDANLIQGTVFNMKPWEYKVFVTS